MNRFTGTHIRDGSRTESGPIRSPPRTPVDPDPSSPHTRSLIDLVTTSAGFPQAHLNSSASEFPTIEALSWFLLEALQYQPVAHDDRERL